MTDKQSKLPNIRINKVYTRTGDAGKTRLARGEERFKDDIRVKTYGSVDELNAHIGMCRALLRQKHNQQLSGLIKSLYSVQHQLFNLGSQLSIPSGDHSENMPKLSNNAIKKLEYEIDISNQVLGELKSFILPGSSIINSQFHIARNVCRRAERRAVSLLKKESIAPENIRYLNRLSDALFVWSRWVSHIIGEEENLWDPNQ